MTDYQLFGSAACLHYINEIMRQLSRDPPCSSGFAPGADIDHRIHQGDAAPGLGVRLGEVARRFGYGNGPFCGVPRLVASMGAVSMAITREAWVRMSGFAEMSAS